MVTPSDSVRIVLFDSEFPDYFLILCEADDPTNWKLPGGKLEAGESPLDGIIRETAEELGIIFDKTAITVVADLLNNDGVSKRYIYSSNIAQNKVAQTSEVAQIAWITASTIPPGLNSTHIASAVAAVHTYRRG
jgi:8-oxo-dGTP pyrophosphatase MutT (NUDIX family)